MSRAAGVLLLLIVGVAMLLSLLGPGSAPPPLRPPPAPAPMPPAPIPEPVVPKPRPCPGPGPCPRPCPGPCPRPHEALVGAHVGGGRDADGSEIDCDLPTEFQRKNIASKGLGCCVFRSIDHAGHWQNLPALYDFPEWMVKSGIEGGGYPSKAAKLIAQISKDRGLPEPRFLQVEGDDLEILKLACRSGRMPCVTYGFSPSGRYNGQNIAHMVNIVAADDKHVVVLDNNYVCSPEHPDNYEWLTPEEFKRAYTAGGGGWALILLEPSPPPAPHN